MPGSDQARVLLQGTAILALAAFISKVLGVIYRIPYQNITGDEGLFVYSSVYPIYMILLTLATAGIPVAISKIVSERLVLGDRQGAKKVFKVSAMAISCTGLFFFVILYLSAPFIAFIIGDAQLVLPIRWVSTALLVVPIMASIRGYFQGHQNMVPTAVSQVLEQIIRVATILVLSYWFMHTYDNVYYAGSGAVFGATTGSVAALIVLLFYWKKVEQEATLADRHKKQQVSTDEHQLNTYENIPVKSILKKIASYAIPISLGALVLPLFQLVDSFSIPRLLMFSGWESDAAKNLRGVFDRGQPLVQFAAFFAVALALALVPSISEAQARQNYLLISRRTQLATKLTFIVGLPSAFGLAFLARPINIMLYMTDAGTQAISTLAFVIIFTTLCITTAAILQGLGHVIIPARNIFIGVLVKLAGNFILIPYFDITGAAIASVLGYGVAALLNLRSLYTMQHYRFSFNAYFKPALAVLVMIAVIWLFKESSAFVLSYWLEQGRTFYAIIALSSVFAGIVAYGVAALKFQVVSREELNMIPPLRRWVPLLERLRIVKPE